MLSGAFALLERSLRVDTRGRSTHLIRLGLMLGIYFALCNALITAVLVGAPGLNFFQSIAFLDVVFLTLLGIGFFSTVITEEKEEDVLGLMLMAGISPMGILTGKSVGGLFQAMLLIAVQFPFILLAVTMGGVTRLQVLAFTIALLAYVIFLAGFGLLCSTLAPNNKASARWTFLGIFLYFTFPIIAQSLSQDHALNVLNGNDTSRLPDFIWTLVDVIGGVCIYLQMDQILTTGFQDSLLSIQVISNIVMGALAAVLAWLCFGVAANHPSSEAATRGLVARQRAFFRFSAGRVWSNPFCWKDYYFVSGGTGMTLLRIVFFGALGLIPALVVLLTGLPDQGEWLWLSIIAMIFSASVSCASVLARSMHDEIRGQTLSSLMMLPRSAAEIVYSKYAGALLGWLPGTVIGPCTLFTSDSFRKGLDEIFNSPLTSNGPYEWSVFMMGILIFILFLALIPHFAALAALYVRWGAVPLAIGMTFGVYMGLMMLIVTGSLLFVGNFEPLVFMGLIAIFLFGLCGGCHLGILLRVQALAAK